jgi:hypothetical protein
MRNDALMTDRERDPAESDDWPLGRMIRTAMQGRSENSIAELSKAMGEDYRFSRGTLRHYTYGFREDPSKPELKVVPDTVRRIAAVLELDPREALHAAGLHHEAERQPPRTKVDAPLDTKEELADKLERLPFADRQALQRIIDSLVAKTETPEQQTQIVSVSGGKVWRGHQSSPGSGTQVPVEEARG